MSRSPDRDGQHNPIVQVPVGCPNAPFGCACTGRCHELIPMVPAETYWRAIGERDEAREQHRFAEQLLADVLREARET
jgi:hypothetical protein